MKFLERCAELAAAAALLGPVNFAGMLVGAALSAVLFACRLVARGYYRCLLSSR